MTFEFEKITSRKNPKIIFAASLSLKKNREETGEFAIEGIKLICEALNENVPLLRLFFTETAMTQYSKEIENAKDLGAEGFLVSDEVYDKLTCEKGSQGIFAVAKKDELPLFEDSENAEGCVVLESLQDPGNVGAIIRSCAALGVKNIIVTEDCADIYSHKVLRASMGTVFKVKIYRCKSVTECVKMLKGVGKVYATALSDNSIPLSEITFSQKDSIIIGNEGHGVSDHTLSACDSAVIIPMMQGTESLNASVAASIFIWEKQKSYIDF